MKNICEILRERIIRLHYAPGETIDETKLAKEFKVSRTPIREAIIRLSGENLVISDPYSKARVSDINFRDFKELIELRLTLERAIAKMVTRRISEEGIHTLEELEKKFQLVESDKEKQDNDIEFHNLFWQMAGNKPMTRYLSITLNQFLRVRNLIEAKSDIEPINITKIVAALKGKDSAKVEAALIEHVEVFVDLVRDHFRKLVNLY